MGICIKEINNYCELSIDQLIEKLAFVYCFEEPETFDGVKQWWSRWLTDEIPGDKLTAVAEDAETEQFVGVVRFWKSPYCGNKWLIEGLEVISPKRRSGLGRAMVGHGIELLKNKGVEKISANIFNGNIASIRLHESLGFNKVSTGSINSLGDYREKVDEYQAELLK